MRGQVLAIVAVCAGCVVGGRPPRSDRDDRFLRAMAQQERWAQQAVDARPAPLQLDRIRQSDFSAVAAGRKELQRLIQAIDRGTWVRDAAADLLRQDPADGQLAQQFDRGGMLRTQALQAADELASALAEARGGLTEADLRPGLDAVRKAQASEDRLAGLATRGNLRLLPAPLPLPRPFSDASARLSSGAPAGQPPGQGANAAPPAGTPAPNAETERSQEERRRSPSSQESEAGPAPAQPQQGTEAEAPSTTLTIAADAAQLLAKRVPRSITLREDGLFELGYDDGAYLVAPDGKLVRKEPAAGQQRK